jgi:poly(3-hydroxybutyrate) depolymerase
VLYRTYEINRRAGAPIVASADLVARGLGMAPPLIARRRGVRRVRAFCDVMSRARPTHTRPPFGIDRVHVRDDLIPVRERALSQTPFATLLHFEKQGVVGQPRVLVVGPLSGHFTTLITPTIRTLLGDHDVHVLDWHNARDVPLEHGPFGLDDYIEHVMAALRELGAGVHVVAVCQPAVPVLAAVSLLAAADDDSQPRSMTLIAGPIDTRINPNRVNDMAAARPMSFFERRVITRVPSRYAGAGRRVYPGFVQLAAFMNMNRGRHLRAHYELYRDLAAGDTVRAATTRAFYDEYGAVMDVPAEFYLETVERIFKEHLLARGELTWRGQHVDPGAIRRTALLTVEGANDDICSPGQTRAAHELCTAIPSDMRQNHLQPGVGHYGVFSGSRWEQEIYPEVRSFIRARDHDARALAAQGVTADG